MSKEKAQKAAAQRQLDTNSAQKHSHRFSTGKGGQQTLNECKAYVDIAKGNEALERSPGLLGLLGGNKM